VSGRSEKEFIEQMKMLCALITGFFHEQKLPPSEGLKMLSLSHAMIDIGLALPADKLNRPGLITDGAAVWVEAYNTKVLPAVIEWLKRQGLASETYINEMAPSVGNIGMPW
jgi:hypothetical protein